MGFLNTQDLIAHHVALREASIDFQDPPRYLPEAPPTKLKSKQVEAPKDEAPVATQSKNKAVASYKPVPSAIKFGSSEPIELYKPHVHGKGKNSRTESKPSAAHAKPSETTVSQIKVPHDKAVQQTKKKLAKSPVAVTITLDTRSSAGTESVGDAETHSEVSEFDSSYVDGTSTELMLMRGAAKYKDCVLDIPLSFIKNLSAYQRSRLEENGFHTVS